MENNESNLRMPSTKWEVPLVVSATLVGFVLRLYHLGDAPLQSLEIYTWDFSHQSVRFIFERLAYIETNPPLYYLLMKLVMKLGESEFVLRLPSVLAGTLAIPLVYVLGRFGGASSGGAIGAALLALSALNITYSRQARTYALAQDFCLLAAIAVVIIISASARRGPGRPESNRRAIVGWTGFTFASITGFYLHYTFVVEIVALECAILVAWLAKAQSDRQFLLRWVFSSLIMLVGMAWGLALARSQAYSGGIGWMQVPSLLDAADLLVRTNGYTAFYRLQPWPSLLLLAVACTGLATGWRRSAAILVAGSLFVLFPLILFVISQTRPMFIERVLVPPSFSVCLLAGSGAVFLVQKFTQYRESLPGPGIFGLRLFWTRRIWGVVAVAMMLAPAAVSARNSLRDAAVLEPYDKATDYVAAAIEPGDAAAGTDGVIYYRRRLGVEFPYFKIIDGDRAESEVTYGSPAVHVDEVTKLAPSDRYIYVVLREKLPPSQLIRDRLGQKAPLASFGDLGIYRVQGACAGPAPCLDGVREETQSCTDRP
jgi:4-amino-4-deoxy-L-arabinose transferase-like glycosyltransferase